MPGSVPGVLSCCREVLLTLDVVVSVLLVHSPSATTKQIVPMRHCVAAQKAFLVLLEQPVVADRVAAVAAVVVVVYPDGEPSGDPELQPLGFHLWSPSPPHCRQ